MANSGAITDMETQVRHVSEADAVRDMASLLKHVEAGMEVVIERDAKPVAVVRPAVVRRTISGLAPTLDTDFAEDVEEIIRARKPWHPPSWE